VSGGRAVLAIAGNELRRVARDRVALIVGIAVPLVIMLVVGSAFGSEDDALDVGLLDRDRTPASADLVASLEDAGGLSVTTYDDPDDLRLEVRTDVENAGLVIPAATATTSSAAGPFRSRCWSTPPPRPPPP